MSMPAASLEQQINDFRIWRNDIARTIGDYRDWLDATGGSDIMQDLRLFDMAESLRNDRLVLAFVAEFSRGKTETINALFFSDFKQRLLPSDAGRTTMCPTELYWDSTEAPYIKLLPIESRMNDDSLSVLKKNTQMWTKLRLDTNSADAMKDSLQVMVQHKEVTLEVARKLGLWDDNDITMVNTLKSKGVVDIPVWRHALINYPHPLLESGLVILDTPGLNTLGTEPELTLSIIPSAHAVIFLMATDAGVTKSDMEIWTNHIRDRVKRKLAILNKIDILWDALKPEAEINAMIQAQVELTARQLNLPTADVFAISAQKALVAKIKEDPELLAKSGIEHLERVLANDLVSTKHEILRSTIVTDASSMLKDSRKVMRGRLNAINEQMKELGSLKGQNRDVIQGLLSKVSTDRKLYEETVRTFTKGNQRILQLSEMLLSQLSIESLDIMLEKSRQQIGDSWTTMGLNRGMKSLIAQTTALADQINQQSNEIKHMADELYRLFHTQHGFEMRKPPVLDMSRFHKGMEKLELTTEEFCADPINIMTEKHFLVKKFFNSLIGMVREMFEQTNNEASLWLKGLLGPLKQQIAEHKAQLDKRTESLMKVHDNLESLQKNINELQDKITQTQAQTATLDLLLLKLMKAAQHSTIDTPTTTALAA